MVDGSGESGVVDATGQTVNGRHLPKVAICVLTRGICNSGFAFDLANLVGYATATLVQVGVDLGLTFYMTTYVQTGRSECMRTVLQDPAVTHLLWLDDDMRFPKNTLERLLMHEEPVVGANYVSRLPPYNTVAIKSRDRGERLNTMPDSTGLEEVDALGFGVCLVARPVLEKIPYPWSDTVFREKEQDWIGDDVYFFDKVRAHGFTVYADHDLSKEVRHCGSFEFDVHKLQFAREAAAADRALALR
jgi:hypothetical protein